MLVKSVFVKELSRTVEVIQAETNLELIQRLNKLDIDITETEFKKWVIEHFVLSIPQELTVRKAGGAKRLEALIDVLYATVILLNEDLNPENLYADSDNTITLHNTGVKLTECASWGNKEPIKEDRLYDISEYFQFVESARTVDHDVEIERWDLLGISVCVRKFVKKQSERLFLGFAPKTAEDIKYFVVVISIDNFNQLYHYVTTEARYAGYSFQTIIDSLYKIVLDKNPFLKIGVNKIHNINKNYVMHKASTLSAGSEIVGMKNPLLRNKLAKVPKKTIQALEETLLKNIFGQDEAIRALCKAIKRAYIGIKPEHTPIGAFLFYGQTSTGKTELAKVLAKTLINSPTGLIKIPCNTLTASHTVHTLIGSPPGYVGYEEKGLFNKAFENGSFKVVLFDEIEKATPKLIDLVLEMIEEGKILMADGTVINLQEALFIFTSNIGQSEARKAANTAGFSLDKDQVGEKLKIEESTFKRIAKEKLKPEFLARLNGIFYFKPLEEKELVRVCELHFFNFLNSLAKRKIFVKFSEDLPAIVVRAIISKNKMAHARDIRNYIEVEILPKLGDFIIAHEEEISADDELRIHYQNEAFSFEIIKPQKPHRK